MGFKLSLHSLYILESWVPDLTPTAEIRVPSTELQKGCEGEEDPSFIFSGILYWKSGILFSAMASQLGKESKPLITMSLAQTDPWAYSAYRSQPTNASLFQELYLTNNDFTRVVPMNLSTLQYLNILFISGNRLGMGKEDDLNFTNSLPNCSNLKNFGFDNNSFKGMLPNSIANLSTRLIQLVIGFNHLYGSIPEGIGNLELQQKLD